MTASSEGITSTEPVERFRPTSGSVVGYGGLIAAGVGVAYVVLAERNETGLRVALALSFVGVVIWVTQLRPRAVAYRDRLVLRNSLRDTQIPLSRVDEVTVRHTLNVWVDGRRHVCIGIGRPRTSALRSGRRGTASLLGMGRLHELAEAADRPHPDQSGMAYDTFVVTRIEELVEEAKRSSPESGRDEPVRRAMAWPETVALVVLGVAFVVSLLV